MNGTSRKRSWSELLAAVKSARSRCLAGRQSSRTPNNFTFSETKLYFLALPEDRSEYTLFYVELKSGEQGQQLGVVPTAKWHLLLDLESLRPFQGFSREEQLLRERKRMGSFGITSYEYDKNSRSILFPACSSLYMCRDHVLPSVSAKLSNINYIIIMYFTVYYILKVDVGGQNQFVNSPKQLCPYFSCKM